MLVCQATKREFLDDVDTGAITSRIRTAAEQRVHRANERKVRSWANSMQHMHKTLNAPAIPYTSLAAIDEKLAENAEKYPSEKARGSREKYRDL